MPTLLGHSAIPVALALAAGSAHVPRRLLWAGVAAALVPDLDVISFRLGISYSSDMGHRGITHSLVFALTLALLAAWGAGRLKSGRTMAFVFVFLATASHGLLDMVTNGGKGVAFLWPFTSERFFFPVQVIQVSPLSVQRLLGPAGLHVLYTELQWVWVPAIVLGTIIWLWRRQALDLAD